MKPQKVRKVIKALGRLGFKCVRQTGSHIRFVHPDGRKTSIPNHAGEDLGPGILNLILKQIEMTWEEFKKYL